MSLLLIAWRNFQQRALSSILTTISLALGVGLTVLVLAIFGVMTEAFQRNASVGYNLVIGAKGSPLQLTLNTVYFLSQPIENVPYSYYLEFFSAAERRKQLESFGGKLEEPDRAGKFSRYTGGGVVIPVCLGDYYDRFRLVGTTPDMFEKLQWGPNVDQPFKFASGRNFQTHSPEHGYFESVIGWRVARELNLKVGDVIHPAHGDPEGKIHDEPFTIVGILAPTGTPNDRAAFVNIEGFYLMEGHAKPVDELPVAEGVPQVAFEERTIEPDQHNVTPLPLHQREVTAILLRPAQPMFAIPLQNTINEGLQAQAAAPIGEIAKMMEMLVGPMKQILLLITVLTCVVAAVGILVSIYNSMNDRQRDISVMRALGARQETVMWVVLFESGLIAFLGGLMGWVLAHLMLVAASGVIEDRTGIVIGFFSFSAVELWIIPIVLSLAALAGLLPALVAYRTDVGRHLNS